MGWSFIGFFMWSLGNGFVCLLYVVLVCCFFFLMFLYILLIIFGFSNVLVVGMVVFDFWDINFWIGFKLLLLGVLCYLSKDIWRFLLFCLVFFIRFFVILMVDLVFLLFWLCNGELVVCWNFYLWENLLKCVLEYCGLLLVIMLVMLWCVKWCLVVFIIDFVVVFDRRLSLK